MSNTMLKYFEDTLTNVQPKTINPSIQTRRLSCIAAIFPVFSEQD
jgi:hypothetical protein